MIIDATNLIAGRLATVATKKALLGEKVDIINCEKAVFTGSRQNIFEKYKSKTDLGRNPYKGPFYPKASDMLIKRLIRGMLPYKQEKGKNALKRIMCYVDVPTHLKGQKAETIPAANISKLPNYKYLKVGELAKLLGSKR